MLHHVMKASAFSELPVALFRTQLFLSLHHHKRNTDSFSPMLCSLSIETAFTKSKSPRSQLIYTDGINMSPPSSTQDNLDAAAAFLRNFVTAQQQQPQQPSPAPQAPAPAPQSQTPAYLQQLVLAAQQQYQQQQNATAPAPQPPAQPQGLDPNIAQLLAQAMNMAQQQNQRQAAAPSAAPVAPQPQPYQHMPQQQSVPTYGSAPPTSSPPAAAPTQQQQQQSLLSSAHLLGCLNPTLAAALMSSALQQSITTPAVPAAAAPPVATGADAEQPVATLPPAAHHVPSLPVPFGLTGTNAFQQHRTPPVIHSITKMQKWSLEQLGKFDDVLLCLPFLTLYQVKIAHTSLSTHMRRISCQRTP